MSDQLRLFELPPPLRVDLSDPHCVDCDVRTLEIGDFYMVRDDIWPLDQVGGMLCIRCLEQRIGRRLVRADLLDVPCNRWLLEEMSTACEADGEEPPTP